MRAFPSTGGQAARACTTDATNSGDLGRQRLGRLQNGAAWRHLHGGDAPCVQHHEPVTMSAAKHASIVRKRRNGMLDDLVVTAGVGLLVRDI
jgi:hypothetical protein